MQSDVREDVPLMKPAEHISFAHLFKAIPMEEVKASLCATNRNDQRERDLPARFIVFFVIALSLYSDCSSAEVFRQLVETLKNMFGPAVKFKVPAKSSLTYARTKLGVEPFRDLFRKVARPLECQGSSLGAFFKNYRLVSLDGSHFNVPDTVENEARFGRAKTGTGPAAFPLIRSVAKIEIGTRAILDFEHGAGGGSKEESENKLARELLTRLKKDELCIADRLYANYPLWMIAQATGAALLWRAKADFKFEPIKELPDGSYLARLQHNVNGKAKDHVPVRIIEYSIGENNYRLITNLPHDTASAKELADLYHERWEHEIAIQEQKQGLNAYLTTLRSKTPDLVEQELIGLYLMHYLVRSLMHEAAKSVDIDVDRLSFKHAIKVIRRRSPQVGAFSP